MALYNSQVDGAQALEACSSCGAGCSRVITVVFRSARGKYVRSQREGIIILMFH